MKVSQCGTFQELLTFLQVWSQQTIKCYDGAGSREDHRSLELPASEIAAQINASQSSSNRHISTHQLFRGDCVNQAFMVELLQRNHY